MKYTCSLKFFFICCSILPASASAQLTVFEKSNGTKTATYFEAVQFYKSLSANSSLVQFQSRGFTDAGYPLNLIMISNDGEFDPVKWHRQHRVVILINNGIHPGEPDGIDASMLLARDIITKKNILPDNVALAIIPLYNIGGALNRNSFSRANQNGPESYGFRGNAQNLDLNRDFIKCDSKNARSFTEIFHYLEPDILIDTHVSDGADYQHVMTLITTQYDKLGKQLGSWVKNTFVPAVSIKMKSSGWDLVPYINVEDSDPSKGVTQFYDEPRYSSGYAALFNTISFMPETHMLKPYFQRVQATYSLIAAMILQSSINANELLAQREAAIEKTKTQKTFYLTWVADTSNFSTILFKGYEAGYKKSEATNSPVLYYDHTKPFTKEIKFYDTYIGKKNIVKPVAYVIPQGWWQVMDLITLNKVQFNRLQNDTAILVTTYHIDDYKSYPKPYEKHHKNYHITTSSTQENIKFLKGDYIVYLNQPANRYLVETLEPEGDDGFFSWNFFDAILQQKEGYSEYRWDSIAAILLKNDLALQKKMEGKKLSDSTFKNNAAAQLDFIYKNSPYYEAAHLRYPVYRIEAGL